MFGGRCVLGFQSIGEVSSTYGHGEAQTIVESCSNTLILRCSASENGGTSRGDRAAAADLSGYLKFASHPAWRRICLDLN